MRRLSGSEAGTARRPIPWESLLSERVRSGPAPRPARLAGAAEPEDSVDLAMQSPAPELLPTEALRACVDHVLRTEGPACLGYADDDGVPRLRAAIAADLAQLGMTVGADEVVVTSGSQQALDLLARALVDPGDPFLVEDATYPGALRVLAISGARLVAVRSDDEGPALDDLARAAAERPKGLYVMPNLRNPTATTISAARRRALVAWSHDAGVPLVEDDYDADLDLDGAPPAPRLRALDSDVCHVGTYSKRLIPALRIGYLVCPPALRARVVTLKRDLDNGGSGLVQHALAEFLERGGMREHLARTLVAYRARRDALQAALAATLPAGFSWTLPPRGLFLWIRLPDGLSAEVVADEARRHGVRVLPSVLFTAGGVPAAAIRLTYCRERPERLAEGARRLGAAIRAVAGRATNRTS